MIRNLLLIAVLAFACGCTSSSVGKRAVTQFANPVVNRDAPDPTVIRAEDGSYYMYSTQRDGNLPIYKSADMISWEYLGGAFRRGEVPKFVPKAGIWAPDISRVGDKYVLYFSMSTWGGEWACGIGRAVSDRPEGPFENAKFLFDSKLIGVQNSIDPMLFQEDGRCFLVWGSFHGIYLAELTEDGLELDDIHNIHRIAGSAYEGSYIHYRKGYYYLFASVGACCEGLKSTYKTVVGRSKSLYGPYVDREGRKMLDNCHEVLLEGCENVKGPGHNSQIVKDDKGADWIFYHGYDVKEPRAGRKMYLGRVIWDREGWPVIGDDRKTRMSDTAPVIK